MNHSTTSPFKRWLAVLSLMVGIVLGASAESVGIDGLFYELNTTDRTATLTYQTTTTDNYASIEANLVVPSYVTYNGVSFSVTGIADKAFANCTKLESISIPSSVVKVGDTNVNYSSSITLPFYNCTSLKSVRFEDGNTPIRLGVGYSGDSYAKGLFNYAPLEEVYIGRNITYQDYSSSFKFENYPSRYGYSAFYNQPKLTKVIIGGTVSEIPSYLFYKCNQLTTLNISGSALSAMPKHAFSECHIDKLYLPNTLKNIEEYAFSSNSTMTLADLGSSVESIGNYAFSGCGSLIELKVGQKLTTIGDYAFKSMGSLTSNVKPPLFPMTLESIGEYAFANSHIPAIDIPNSVTEIGKYAFSSNSYLTSFKLGNGCKTLAIGVLSDCSALTEVVLLDGLTTISNIVFLNCTKLESISIPSSVVKIGDTNVNYSSSLTLPFYNCTSLKSVRFEDGNTPIQLGVGYSSDSYAKGLFNYAPLEEVYIGRNIIYQDYSSSYKFENYPSRYGYSAFYNQPKLTKVSIGEAVTEIPAYLFYNNASITLMTLPNVERIGKAAFRGCSKLTTLNLGNSLTTVGDEAFYECSNVTKLTFPNSTQSIGASAFYNCSSVTEVTVGLGLRAIGANGFYGCKSFTALILPNDFTTMGESAFEGCTKLTVAKLGESIDAVPAKAFKNCISLSEMVIPGTAISIGDQAFYNDSGLATITMNEGLKTIGSQVFWNNSGVIRFTIPGTVTSIGTNSFYGCTSVSYFIFSDGDETLTIDNASCRSSIIDAKTSNYDYYNRKYDYFYDCPIRFLTLGRNLKYSYYDNVSMYDLDGSSWKSVYRASAPFVNKKDLRVVTIGPKVTFLYHHLFEGCTNLATLHMGQNLETIYTYAFKNCDKLAGVDFPETLKVIGNYAFNHCDILASTTFKESTTHTLSINDASFKDCVSLTGVTFPGQLNKLGNSTYSNCPILKDVVFNDNQNFKPELIIGDYTFEKCPQIQSLSFPGRLTSIGNFTFKECTYLANVSFEDSFNAVKLGYGAANASGSSIQSLPLFGNSNLQSLYLGRNIIYNAKSEYGYSPFYNQQWLTDVRFGQAGTVTYNNDYLLYKVNNCEELLLPESLSSIGSYTFAGMTVLKGITIPNKVSTMGTYAFSEDDGLKYAKLSTGCAWLKEGVFNHCDSLEYITIPPVVTKMDTKLFAYCKSLATVTFEGSSDLIEMGYGASQPQYGMFRDCPVETLNLDRWLSYNTEVASRSPFYSIPTLKNINIGENVGVIDKYMFSYCTGLEDLYLPDNIESVGLWGFRGCSSLKSVRFSEKLSQVSDYGFSECTSLDNVVFPASMTSVADNSFSNCTSLKKLDLGKSLNIIGPAAFKNDVALEGIEIPETLYGLGVEAFANCTSLPNVTIRAITSVGKQAFQGCTGLKWVSLSDKTTSLGENSFAGCSGINYIKSYAEFPPEGLVNFVESVPTNGTLFVPENSIDYYQYSPTWETWLDIRPLNENIMVSTVSIDKSEISFKATETVQLIAEVGAEEATDKGILWRTSNADIVTVDGNGLVTAVSVGEASITALAADGSGAKAICHVIVVPTMVESITINSTVTSLKKGRTIELTATVAPATATNSTYTWTTSNPDIATVDSDGIVKALSSGNIDIIATANDGSEVTTSFALTVIPPTKGDSNDNDVVTISDAVNTANYAVGNEVEQFNVEAADVNGDNRISVADASGTVAIVLDQPVQTSSMAKVCALASATDTNSDKLVIDDYSAKVGETTSVFVALDNTLNYVALQADVTVPEGMTLDAVNIGNRAEGYHSLAVKRVDDRTMRIALFDINNSIFADNDEAVLELVVKVKETSTGAIEINNILSSDAQAHEYVLTAIGGNNSNMSGIDNVGISNIRIETAVDGINIYNAEGCEVAIYSVDGTTLAHFIASSDVESRKVVPGVYVVTAGDKTEKVMVK